MCAIGGILGAPGAVDPGELVELRDRMRHRGPDDAGVYLNSDRSVGLAHRRLSILDLSERGRQPMSAAGGSLWLVFNGEIYNYRPLRRELELAGRQFLSDTDTEVILAAYEQWGSECLHRLRGMFAIGLWDARRRRLLIARDRLGIKPLFYRQQGDQLRFASEIKALLDPAASLDETAVYDFLTYGYVPAPKTIYREIRKLEPGCRAVFEDGKLRLERYWSLALRPAATISPEDAAALLRAKLAEAVDQHLAADVPVGVLLSGGVDSSAVAALSGRRLKTFSIGFDQPAHTETRFARLVADQLQTDHREWIVTREMGQEIRDRIVALYDEPFGDGSAIPTFLIAQWARRHVKVVLSGEGGDEVFGGYNWYRRWLRFETGPPGWRHRWARRAAPLWPDGWRGHWTLQSLSLSALERYAHILGAFSRREKEAVLQPRFARRFQDYDELWHFRRYWREDLDPLTRLQYLDLNTYLPDDVLTKLDRATMAVGLEGRVPWLDHELVEMVFGLPVEVRNPNGEQKFLMKRALQGLVPAAVLERPKKGFSPPLDSWLARAEQGDLAEGCDGLLRPSPRLPHKASYGHGLWRLLVLHRWLRQHG